MLNFQNPRTHIIVTVLGFAMAAFASTAGGAEADSPSAKKKDSAHESAPAANDKAATKPAKKKAGPVTQKDKDFEHALVQSDGVNHPREILSGSGATKKSPASTKAAVATQKDKDFEHALVQSDGVNHPREVLKK